MSSQQKTFSHTLNTSSQCKKKVRSSSPHCKKKGEVDSSPHKGQNLRLHPKEKHFFGQN